MRLLALQGNVVALGTLSYVKRLPLTNSLARRRMLRSNVVIAYRGNSLGACSARKRAHQLDKKTSVFLFIYLVFPKIFLLYLNVACSCCEQVSAVWGFSCHIIVCLSLHSPLALTQTMFLLTRVFVLTTKFVHGKVDDTALFRNKMTRHHGQLIF